MFFGNAHPNSSILLAMMCILTGKTKSLDLWFQRLCIRCLLPAQQQTSLEPKNMPFIEEIQTTLYHAIAQRHEKKNVACLVFDGRDYYRVCARGFVVINPFYYYKTFNN
jgi:hypothetical protein